MVLPTAKTNEAEQGHGRVEVLDLLRMIAVLGVILFHYSFQGPTTHGAIDVPLPEFAAFAKYGYIGVPLFFVISGFVIAYSADGRTATAFAIARVARIYPGFIFCMTVTFFTTLAFGAPQFEATMSQWVANIFIGAPALNQPYMDSAYWTIVTELTFYAWFGLLILGGVSRRRIDLVVLIWLSLSLLNETVFRSYAVDKLFLTNHSGFFAAGLVLYETYAGRRNATVQCLLGLATACAIFQSLKNLQEFRDRFRTDFDDWIGAALVLATIAAVMLAVRVRRVPLPSSLIVAIGGLTYPLYLLHQQVGYIAFLRLEHFIHPIVLGLPIVMALVVASWATWRFVERPAQQLMKMRLSQMARRMGLIVDSSNSAPSHIVQQTALS